MAVLPRAEAPFPEVEPRRMSKANPDNRQKRSWPAIVSAVATGSLVVVVACAAVGLLLGRLPTWLTILALAGVIAVVVIGILCVLHSRCTGYPVGRRYEEIFLARGSQRGSEVLRETLQKRLAAGRSRRRRWRIERVGPGVATLRSPASLASAGERITLKAGDGWLHVSSQSVVPLQALDWGKNCRNVERIRDMLELDTGRPAPRA